MAWAAGEARAANLRHRFITFAEEVSLMIEAVRKSRSWNGLRCYCYLYEPDMRTLLADASDHALVGVLACFARKKRKDEIFLF
jgi:hypothetical protein